DGALRGNGQEGDFDAARGERLGRVQDGVMLNGGGDEVVAGCEDAEEGEIVALSAAGGEDDLGGAAVKHAGDGLTRVIDGGACVLALLMDGTGVAVVLEVERTHCLKDLRKERCGGVSVHVNALHTTILL